MGSEAAGGAGILPPGSGRVTHDRHVEEWDAFLHRFCLTFAPSIEFRCPEASGILRRAPKFTPLVPSRFIASHLSAPVPLWRFNPGNQNCTVSAPVPGGRFRFPSPAAARFLFTGAICSSAAGRALCQRQHPACERCRAEPLSYTNPSRMMGRRATERSIEARAMARFSGEVSPKRSDQPETNMHS